MALKAMTTGKAWRGYLRRAKRTFPVEHCEALWGHKAVDAFRITDFKRMRVNKEKCNSTTVDYDRKELRRQAAAAKAAGKEFLGTIHTHPDESLDSGASATDHHVAAKDGESIMGVVVLYKKGRRFVNEVAWWIPQPEIKFELIAE